MRDEVLLYNDERNALLGGGGGDRVFGGADDDVLDGGEGNDTLYGETGSDTYLFRRGSGQDTIVDWDATTGNVDTIWLGGNLTPDDVVVRRMGFDLVLSIIGTNDTLTVNQYARSDSSLNRIEQIQFMNGVVWGEQEIFERIYAPTEADDFLYGRTVGETMHGLGGDDTYLSGRGSVHDVILDDSSGWADTDNIRLTGDLGPTDIAIARTGDDLRQSIKDTGETVVVQNWFCNDSFEYRVERLQFGDRPF
jgi:trimeric autotransporter adhesin